MLFFRCFSRLDSVGQLHSAYGTHITSAHYSHNSAPPTTRSDGFMWATTSLCCCNACSSSSGNCSSTCRCNTRCCCNIRCGSTLYRAKITPVKAVIFWRRLPTLQQHHSPHPRFDIDTHEGERRCNFPSEDVPCVGLLHQVARAVPSAGRIRARASCCLRRRDCKEYRLFIHNGTKAMI